MAEGRRRWRNRRIATLLTVSVAALTLFTITYLTARDIARQRQMFREDLQEKGELLARTLNDMLANALYFDDIEDLIVQEELEPFPADTIDMSTFTFANRTNLEVRGIESQLDFALSSRQRVFAGLSYAWVSATDETETRQESQSIPRVTASAVWLYRLDSSARRRPCFLKGRGLAPARPIGSATFAPPRGNDWTSAGCPAPRLGIVSQLPALSLLGSLSINASGFASKIAFTAVHKPTGRFSIRCAISDRESPGCTW